ncbi:acyltransferase [Sulfuricurvum sp.]|uniref:acyltransferase family protein n=1 Tax=Sulfuricurvum sp. TaxID=2025608 RepID=UPI00262AB28C|nr:acyltransferase [Sulfuricurvum sp.]MDD2781647.1 acyltransferase [Sulfuricurvum sp.]
MIKIENNFDILRLFLAFLVFVMHWNSLTNQQISYEIFHFGDHAVSMFFIVSGFLIFWSFDKDHQVNNFYIKRFFRIFPLYAIVILLQTLFFIIYSDGQLWQILKYFISNILFLNFLSPSVADTLIGLERNAINGALWTLKNEVAFYVLLPLMYQWYKKEKSSFFITLYLLSISYMFTAEYLHFDKLLVQFPAQLRLFVVGMTLYVFYEFVNRYSVILTVLSILILLFVPASSFFDFVLYPWAIGFILFFIVFRLFTIKVHFDFSYSLYIIHYPIIQLFMYFHINPTNPFYSFVSIFSIILVLALLSEKYLEKPFIEMGKKILKSKYPK